MDQELVFSDEETRSLISLWSTHECLYNSKISAYSDKNLREAAMTAIAQSIAKSKEEVG